MPTVTIEGRKVKVDDGFLSLTPEQQADTVEEIASQIGIAKPNETAPVEKPKVAQGRHLSYEEGLAELEKQDMDSAKGMTASALMGFIEGVPIAGPAILGGTKRAAAGISSLINGKSYADNLAKGDRVEAAAKAANPKANITGQIAGNVATMIPLGATAVGARALGITGPNLAARAGMSALSSGAISAADTAARGGDAKDIVNNTTIGMGLGAAIPVVGSGLSAAGRVAGDAVAPMINAVRDPSKEAARRLGVALTRDINAAPSSIASTADEAVARQNNIPLLNVDRGGETTRALARSVANQSPEARAVIEKTANDRFGTQGTRAADFISRVAGGKADDLAYREILEKTARVTNRKAYNEAMDSTEAQAVFTKPIQELMQSPSFRNAVKSVPARSADRGAVDGFKEIANPFSQNSKGDFVLRQKADGSIVLPSLRFWDMVKRNLDSQIGVAQRAGDNSLSSDLMALKSKLVSELDTAIPAYRTARQGAAGFFDAEDALDAGRKFATTPKAIPEAKKAFDAFSKAEKEAFATGYASELIDRIKATGDRTNVINSVFKNQSARESMELVFGPQKMKEIEAYVRVEDLADRLRGTMGNSTTARQLVELGIGAGGGALATGDWTGAVTGAAAMKGARYLGQRVDNEVMQRIAKMLMSDNRANLNLAVRQAAATPAYMEAIERMGNALAAPTRSGAVMAGQ